MVMGGAENRIEGNHITSHAGNGVLIVPSAQRPLRGAAARNVVTGNVVGESGRADISVGGPAASANCIDTQVERTRLAPRSLGCRDGRAVGTQADLIPWMATVIRGVRLSGATSPGWQEQPAPPMQPTMPDVVGAATPAVDVFAGYLATRSASGLPKDAEEVSRAALDRGGLPIHTWAPGVAVTRLQAKVPFTLRRLGLALALLVAARLAVRAGENGGRRLARRAWAVAVVAVIAWVGLACAAALALSQM
jgi:hypothetical protein